jgi:hypothetical protein
MALRGQAIQRRATTWEVNRRLEQLRVDRDGAL